MMDRKESVDNRPRDTIVSRSAGAHQTNGVYYYIVNHQSTLGKRLSERGYQLEGSRNPVRNAWYIKPLTLPSHSTFFESFILTGEHLSIDADTHKSKKGLSPNHYTATYEYESVVRQIHVYFNLDGSFRVKGTSLEIEIKEYNRDDSENFVLIPINKALENSIKNQAKPYQVELQELANAKIEAYLNAYDVSHDLNQSFARLLLEPESQENLLLIQSKVIEYKDLVRLVGLYDEAILTDGREHLFPMIDMQVAQYKKRLQHVLNLGDEKQPSSQYPSDSLEIPNPTKENAHVSVTKEIDPDQAKYEAISKLVDAYLKKSSAKHINVMTEVSYVDLINLQKELIELELSCQSEEIETLCRAQEQRVKKYMDKIAASFKSELASGNLAFVETRLTDIEPYINLKQTYFDLLLHIEGHLDAEGAYQKGRKHSNMPLIAMANFLYQHSSVYQSVLQYFQMRFREISLVHSNSRFGYGFGPLARAIFLSNDENVLQMYLSQGISADSAQFNIAGHPFAYSSLYAIIFFAKNLPDTFDQTKFPLFINMLFDHGASLSHTRGSVRICSEAESRARKEKLGIEQSSSTLFKQTRNVIPSIQTIIETDAQSESLLTVAQSSSPSIKYNLVLNALVAHATPNDLNILYNYFVMLVDSIDKNFQPTFIKGLVFYPQFNACSIFKSSHEKKYVLDHLEPRDSEPLKKIPCNMLFTLNPRFANNQSYIPLFEITHTINEKIRTILSGLNKEEMRTLIDALMKQAKYFRDINKLNQYNVTLHAGFYATLSIDNPDMSDYDKLLSFEFFILKEKKRLNIPINDLAQQLKEQLSPKEQANLEAQLHYKLCKRFVDSVIPSSSAFFQEAKLAEGKKTDETVVQKKSL